MRNLINWSVIAFPNLDPLAKAKNSVLKYLLSLGLSIVFLSSYAQLAVGDISLTTSGSGNGGEFIIGDMVTAQWVDPNGDDASSVDIDFTEFGGGSVAASNAAGTWTASYTITAGSTENTTADVIVTVTGGLSAGGPLTDDEDHAVDDVRPTGTMIANSIGTVSDSDAGGTITFTVTFSETMNTGVDPVVAFPTENPGAAFPTLNGASGWTGNQYLAIFDIVDTNLDLGFIDVNVTGGEDAAGNVSTSPWVELDLFNIDTENPSLTAAAATPSTGTLVITDMLVADITEGSGEAGLSVNSATINGVDVSASFSDNTGGAYDFTYTVAGGNTDRAAGAIPISIILEDAVGNTSNTLTAWTDGNTTAVDANAPSATGIVSDIAIISDSDAGNDVTFTVSFDEPMNTGGGADPVIDFPEGGVTGLAFNAGLSGWNGNDYEAVYDITDTGLDLSGIDVRVSGGEDAAGNGLSAAYTEVDEFAIDTENPSATGIVSDIAIISDSDAGNDVTFTVSFDEPMNTGGGADPVIDFPEGGVTGLAFNAGLSGWNGNDYEAVYDVTDTGLDLAGIDVRSSGGEDANGNTLSSAYTEVDEFAIDTENPTISSVSIPDGNAHIRIVFSEAVANSDGNSAVDDSDFAISNFTNNGSAGATAVNITTPDGVTDDFDAPLTTGGWSILRVSLDVIGLPDTDDQFQIGPSGSAALYDVNGNAMSAAELSSVATLDEVNLSDVPAYEWIYPNTDNSIIYIKFTVPVDGNSSTSSFANLVFDDNGSSDDINVINFNNNGSGVSLDINDQTMNPTTGSNDEIWELDVNNITGGTPEGIETYTVRANNDKIYNRDEGNEMPFANRTFTGALLADESGEDFDDATATAYDVDMDGNIDEVEIVMPDGVDDSTIEPGDFDFNGSIGQTFNTGTTSNDNTFRIGFTDYTGTAVVGSLDYLASRSGSQNMRDDAEYSTYEGIILGHTGTRGNIIGNGDLTFGTGAGFIDDAAGPVVVSATTLDTEATPDGQIDEIEIVFSENITEITLAGASVGPEDFTITSPAYTVINAVPGANNVTLTITESGSSDTFIRPNIEIALGIVEDGSGADNPNQDYGDADDGAAAYSTVDNITTSDIDPQITGTIDDVNASILVSVGSNTVGATNNGNGFWTLPAGSLANDLSPVLSPYDVILTTIDPFANIGTDATNNELTITGGVEITPAALETMCVGDDFQLIANPIIIAEAAATPGGFSTSGNLILSLPVGFEFDVTQTPDFATGSTYSGDLSIDQETAIDPEETQFSGAGSLSIEIDVTGTAGQDEIYISNLWVRAVGPPVSPAQDMYRSGGDIIISVATDTYGTFESNAAPAPLTFLEDADDLGTPLTQYIKKYTPIIRITYPIGPVFSDGEDFVFSGGATATMVPGSNIPGVQLDVYLLTGNITTTETFTGQTSGQVGTVSTETRIGEILLPFTLAADPSPSPTTRWYDDSGGLINSNNSNTNATLLATSPGLYSFDVVTYDGSTCESTPLRFNTLVFNDFDDDFEHTFINRTYVESDDRDTIYLSNPANHTVSVSGAGITVTNPAATELLVLFDPQIAGSTNSPHIITYQIANDNTGEVITQQVSFTVNPVTEFFTLGPTHSGPPEEVYCNADLPITLRLDPTQYGPNVATDLQFNRFFFREWMNSDGIGSTPFNGWYELQPTDLGGAYPWATDINFESSEFTSSLAALNSGDGSALYVQRLTFDPVDGQTIEDFEYYFIYGSPLVEVSNIEENYCESDAVFTLQRNLRYVNSFTPVDPDNATTRWIRNYTTETNSEITNGYTLERWNGSSYVPVTITGAPINTFDPSDPDNDTNTAEDETGMYRITYTTEQLSPANCQGTTTIEFTINATEATPILTTATRDLGSATNFNNNASPDDGVDADEIVLEYCVGDIVGGFSAVENNTYEYNEILTGIVTFAANPGFIPGETIIGQNTGAKGVSNVITATSADFTLIAGAAFSAGEIITGLTSGLQVTITSFTEYELTIETIQGVTSGATATITDLGPNGFVINPATLVGSFTYGEDIIGLSSGDRAELVGAGEMTWYDESFNEIRNFPFNGTVVNYQNRYTIIPAAVGLNTTAANRLTSEESATFYFSQSSIFGCESDLRKVVVNVWDIPLEPILDASAFPAAVLNISSGTPIYTFDYCVENGGASTTPDPLLLDDLLDDESYNVSREFRDFSAGSVTVANTVITEIDGNTNTNQESISVLDLFVGDSIIYTITKTENISIAPETDYSDFPGCTGEEIIIRVVAQEEATSPTELDFVAGTTEFHICEGDVLGNINHTFITGTDEYTWYEDIDGMSNGVSRIGDVLSVGDPMTQTILQSASTTPGPSFVDVPGEYTFYVSRNNDVIDARDFEGCESEAVAVSITVHEIQDAPTVSSDNSPYDQVPADFPDIDMNGSDDVYEFSICSDQLFTDLNFVASDLFVMDQPWETGDERVEWYNASSGNLLFTGEEPDFSDLFLTGLDAQVVTLEVIQVTDTLTDSFDNYFDGCPSPAATVIINISDPAALTVVDISDVEISNSFCRDDPPGSFDVRLNAGGSLITNPVGIVDYEINSYLQSTYQANGTPEDDGAIVMDAFPTLNLTNLHDVIPGTMAVGGEPTVHEVILYYTDPVSFCTGSITKVITIYPDPHISILVDDIDINDPDFSNEACYESSTVSLEGIQYIYDNTGIVGTVNLNDGQFTSERTGTLGGTNGNGNFNPSLEHNTRWSVSGSAGKFLNQSSTEVTFSFSDDQGCDNIVSVDLLVNPEPEAFDVQRVTVLNPSDLAASRPNNRIRLTDFCNDGTDVNAEILMVDPIGGENDLEDAVNYSAYSFTWTLNGDTISDNGPQNISFTPSTTSLNVSVTVVDPKGCSETYSETHQLQTLPNLNIGGITNDQAFCVLDSSPPVLTLIDAAVDGQGNQSTVDVSNIIGWTVDSYSDNNTSLVQIESGTGIPVIDLQSWHTDTDLLAPGATTGGPSTYHTITIEYLDVTREYQGVQTLCSNTVSETIIIHPDPDISFTVNGVALADFVVGSDEFCYYDEEREPVNITLVGIFSDGTPTNAGEFSLNVPGAITTNTGTAVVTARDLHNAFHGVSGTSGKFLDQSEIEITYTFNEARTDGGPSCMNTITTTILVNPIPEFVGLDQDGDDLIEGIQVANSCESDSLRVFVEMIGDENDYRFQWFVNNDATDIPSVLGVNDGDRFAYLLGEGETTVNFRVEATYVGDTLNTFCSSSSDSRTVTEGRLPDPKLSWVGLTAGHPGGTEFTIHQDEIALPGDEVSRIELYVEGVLILDSANNIDENILFPITVDPIAFPDPGQFDVELRITTSTGCDVVEQRTIDILPHLGGFGSDNSYAEGFETTDLSIPDDGWLRENRTLDGKESINHDDNDAFSSWENDGNAPGTPPSGNAVYSNYDRGINGEISYVYSPSFDMTDFAAPTISFDRYEAFENTRDGVILQYTLDDGRTWEIVGTYEAELSEEGLTSTPGWYNTEPITSLPGNQALDGELASNTEGIGWAAREQTWGIARSPLPVSGQPYVRFRFALASQAGSKDLTGFAFDNVEIYDRDQIVLLEVFSSTFSQSSIAFLDSLRANNNFNGSDILTINYFTDLENKGARTDFLNNRISKEANAKSTFYGVDVVPSLGIVGDVNVIDINQSLRISEARLNNAKLNDPGFDVSITASEVNDELIIDTDFTAIRSFDTDSELGLFVAIVEPTISFDNTLEEIPANTPIENVLRKLLPNGAGKYISGSLDVDQTVHLDTTWTISGLMDGTNTLRVIAFAQDLNSKLIYQAASVDVPLTLDAPLSIDEQLATLEVYPNPANNHFTVEFAERLTDKASWVLYDQSGKEILKGDLDIGLKSINVDTRDIPSGLYLIHLYGEDRKRQSRRVVIVH